MMNKNPTTTTNNNKDRYDDDDEFEVMLSKEDYD